MSAAILLSLLLAAVPCPATPASLPAGLEGWPRKIPVDAGATAARATTLVVGRGTVAALRPASAIVYPVRPAKPGSTTDSGGLFVFTVPAAGRYRVALGAGAWVDVLAGTTPAVAVAHAHGPDCTGLHKMVDFDLAPGRYLLQVAGNSGATLPLMVARLP